MCRKQLPCFPEICYQARRSEPNREEGSMDAYAPEIKRKMKRLFDSLSEDDRRRYAAVETTKLGHGGVWGNARTYREGRLRAASPSWELQSVGTSFPSCSANTSTVSERH